MSGTQLTVSHGGPSGETVLLDLPEDSEIGEQEKTTTAAAFLGCVSESARRDDRFVTRCAVFGCSSPKTVHMPEPCDGVAQLLRR